MAEDELKEGLKEEVVETVPPAEAEPAVTGEPEGEIDEPPKLTPEEETAKERLRKLKEDTKYWQQEKVKARAEYFKSRGEPPPETPPRAEVADVNVGPEPKRDDFDDYDKWIEAKIQHETRKARTRWEREQQDRELLKTQEQRENELREKLLLGYEEYEDYDEVFEPNVPINQTIRDALTECDTPHRLAYYLTKNRLEAIRISRLSPLKAAMELKRIEMELSKPENQPTVKKRVSGAPPPIKPTSGGSAVFEKDPDKMTQREYEEWRKEQGARRY